MNDKAVSHELRTFLLGPTDGTRVECWCGWISEHEYISQEAARRAHSRHQEEFKGNE